MISFSTRPFSVFRVFLLVLLAASFSIPSHADTALPNIVVMLADDMGFGEVQSLNRERGKIATPHLDSLAKHGMVFTDAHSGSSVCTPTRYGLMTGRYAFRTRLQKGVLTGGESLIARDRDTIAKLLSRSGYTTAVVGKWHLGMLYDGKKNSGVVPIGATVTHGPIDRGGFDHFWGFHHARQMDQWIVDDKIERRITAVEMLPALAETASQFVREQSKSKSPFFLYVPWNSPHSPVVPSPQWQGKSGLNKHADFVMQTDDAFGKVIAALKETGQFENTLIICTADNGTSAPTSGMKELKAMGHFSSGDLRGSKADIWDGGHRVPFIACWPNVVGASTRTDALVCLTDVIATAAEIVGETLPNNAGEDSISFLGTLKNPEVSVRSSVIHHSSEGQFAIRDNDWKLICCPGSGGWTEPKTLKALKAAQPDGPFVQLYQMSNDLGEQTNLANKMPERVIEMRRLLETHLANGRTTPGENQANDATIVIDKWKSLKQATKKKKKNRSKAKTAAQ